MSKYRVFEVDDVALFGSFAVAGVAAIAFTYHRVGWEVPTLVAVFCGVTFIALAALHFFERWRHKRSISFYTPQGVEVYIDKVRDRWRPEHRPAMEEEIERAAQFWEARDASKSQAIRRRLSEATLKLSDVVLWDESGKKMARGLTVEGRHMTIWWGSQDPFAIVLSLVRHEVGHVCLDAMGLGGDGPTDHAVMVESDYRA